MMAGCNRALIVSVSSFYPGVQLSARPGAERDTRILHRALHTRGYRTRILTDPDAQDIYTAFHTESKQVTDGCFIGVISSHGEEGVVFGADGRPVQLSKIYSYFSGPNMAGKNKLFLIQACRGHLLDDGVEVEADSVGCEDEGLSEYSSVPINTVVMHATAPGYAAFMNWAGSIFLQTFCKLLNDGGTDLEVTCLLTRISYHIAHHFSARGGNLQGKKEMPCFISRLTREFYPFRDHQKNRGFRLSATELLDESYSTRKNSIS
ncbi:caspase-3 [Astyanax mexicanus]|uniref:Caspase 3 n=1 Tax=Astyanax mexicanus TaxID=7994 RepID=A0A8B9LEY3_ASTMX|nr:caspase-3 [Astyanax mexicanus]KAG9263419.1 caspase-3-like [Astyanax mexicanus]